MPRQSGGAYRGRTLQPDLTRAIAPIFGERHVIRTLHPPNRNYARAAVVHLGKDATLSFARGLHTIDALVAVTLPVVRFGRDPADIHPTIEIRL